MQFFLQLALRCANGLALTVIYLQHLMALLRYPAAPKRLSKSSALK